MVSGPKRNRRRGIGVVEWIVLAAAILLVAVGFMATMGRRVDAQLETTAQDAGDPASLARRFGD